MAYKLLVEPAIEPITLSEAKQHLRMEVSDDDALITLLIAAGRQYAEQLTRTSFITQQWSLGANQYLMMGSQAGSITPNGGSGGASGAQGGGNTIINNFTVGDVASMAQVKAAVAASQRQMFAASRRSMGYGGALA